MSSQTTTKSKRTYSLNSASKPWHMRLIATEINGINEDAHANFSDMHKVGKIIILISSSETQWTSTTRLSRKSYFF